jgi:hypothetical protein
MEEVCTDPGGIAVDQIEYLDTAFAVPSLPGYDYQFFHWALNEVNDSNCEYEGPGVFAYGLLSGTQTGFNVYGHPGQRCGNDRQRSCVAVPLHARGRVSTLRVRDPSLLPSRDEHRAVA